MYTLPLFLCLLFTIASAYLQCTLSPSAIPHLIDLTILNTDASDVALLRWNLPFDSRFGGVDPFIVQYSGVRVPYIGVRVKYADPTSRDYLIIRSNQSLEMSIDLRDMYEMNRVGDYKVVFESVVFDVVSEAKFGNIPRTRENFASQKVIGNPVVYIVTETKKPQIKLASPYPCSSSERSTINNAATNYRTLINRAMQVIGTGSTPTYVEWFGAFTEGRWQTARDVLSRSQSNTVVAYACDDTRGVYAYVYPADSSHTIYFCEAFWTSRVIGGFDTQAGTILHELSHFNNIGGTNDWVYGTSGARSLAISNPARAVNNADNFEYFGESQF